ncbi:GNAT family N-acetyltransferase [Roseibium alexandrii]|jgi:ribosomal-protein-alanine N-acetyltransferase
MLKPDGMPQSPRLRFRLPELSDAAFYQSLMSDPDYIRFIADRGITSIEAARAYIDEKVLPGFEENEGVGLWIIAEKDSDDPVGLCGLVVRDGLDMPDLGYAFHKDHRGKGYAQEAAKAIIAFARSELGLSQLCAITHPENARSSALLMKIGFQPNGQKSLPKIEGIADYFVADLQSLS